MKRYKLVAVAVMLCLSLTACKSGGSASSSTLAQGSDAAVNGSSLTSSAPVTQEAQLHMMTVSETIDFFKTLDPADLGLKSDDMASYQIYPSDKAIPVDGMPCMKITAYASLESGNSPEGTFLVARDGTAIYRVVDEDTVEKLDIELR